MGTMNILSQKGDVRITWNPKEKGEVKIAEKTFKQMVKEGYKPIHIYGNHKRGKEMTAFDKNAERILFIPKGGGGDETLANEI